MSTYKSVAVWIDALEVLAYAVTRYGHKHLQSKDSDGETESMPRWHVEDLLFDLQLSDEIKTQIDEVLDEHGDLDCLLVMARDQMKYHVAEYLHEMFPDKVEVADEVPKSEIEIYSMLDDCFYAIYGGEGDKERVAEPAKKPLKQRRQQKKKAKKALDTLRKNHKSVAK
jgi:hypothetical protein